MIATDLLSKAHDLRDIYVRTNRFGALDEQVKKKALCWYIAYSHWMDFVTEQMALHRTYDPKFIASTLLGIPVRIDHGDGADPIVLAVLIRKP